MVKDKAGYDLQQLKFRDRHQDGLSWDMVKVTAERKARERVRSKPDKRLFDAMTPEQEEAFYKIAYASHILTAGLGFKIMRYEDIPRSIGQGLDEDALNLARYKAWRRLCQMRHISGLMAEDVIVYGLSLRESDEGRKMRHGTARTNLFKCLEAWHDVTDRQIRDILETDKNPLDKTGIIRT